MVSETETSAIGNALVVLGAAGIVIPAFARFRLPPVIGFILVGLLVGPSGLGSLTGDYLSGRRSVPVPASARDPSPTSKMRAAGIPEPV